MSKMLRNAKGLTLVELLAVIVILGIVAAIAIPAIGGVISKSKTNADKASEQLIQDAAYRYAVAENLESSQSITVAQLIEKGYLNDVKKPQTGASFSDVTITITNGNITIAGGEVIPTPSPPQSPSPSPSPSSTN